MTITLQMAWESRLKLRAEGSKLRAEGDKLWAETILAVCGNIKIEWRWNKAAQDYDCILETGEHFVAALPTKIEIDLYETPLCAT